MENNLSIQGTLVKKLDKQSGTSKAGKDWEKQDFLVNNGSEYNPETCITAFGKMVGELDKHKEGDEILVDINLYSREYKGKYYTQADAWKIAKVLGSDPVNEKAEDINNSGDEDDLPF